MNSKSLFKIVFQIPNDSATPAEDFSEKHCHIEEGSTIVQAAYQAGVTIQQSCGGTPSCTDCRVQIKSGLETGLQEPEGPENRLMGNVSHITKERLGCQAKIKGELVIFVPKFERVKKQLKNRNSYGKGTRLEAKTPLESPRYGKSKKEENTQKNQNQEKREKNFQKESFKKEGHKKGRR